MEYCILHGAAPYQGLCGRNPHRTGTSPSRRGERYHHTHSGLHPTSREQTLIWPSGVMRVPSSAPQPAAAPLHPPHQSPSTRPPSSGSRASLFVFRDPVQTHLRHSTLTGSPAATVSERGRSATYFYCIITQLSILSLKQSHSVLSLQNNAYICTVIRRKG